MNDPAIMPVKIGTLSAEDKAALREAGVIVIEHENPESIRLVRAIAEVSASDMLKCAMQALIFNDSMGASSQRERFAYLLAKVIGTP
jgi:hypothetical protein